MMESFDAVKGRFLDTYDLIYESPDYTDAHLSRGNVFELAALVGKAVRPIEIDKLWPIGRKSLNAEEAFQVFSQLEEIRLPKTAKQLRIPTENLSHRLQRMDLPGDDRFFMEKYWKKFTDEKGEFELERFTQVLADDRETYLDDQDELRAFYHELRDRKEQQGSSRTNSSQAVSERSGSSAERGEQISPDILPDLPLSLADHRPSSSIRPTSMQESIISEDPLVDAKSSSGCGFLTLTGTKHCVGVYFTVTKPTLFNLSFRVKRHSHIPDKLYKYEIIGYVKNEDTNEIVAVTTRIYRHEEDGEEFKVFGTGTMEFATGSYHFAVTSLEESYSTKNKEEDMVGYKPMKFVNEDGGISAHFRVLLYDIFDVFDINMNKLLEKSEFDLFTHLSENNMADGGTYMSDEEWTKLSEIFSFDPKKGMPLSAFINMFKAEVSAGPDALNDIAINMRNVGVNDKFEQNKMCPYKLYVSSIEKQQLRSQLFDVHADATDSLPYFFFDRGEELMEYDTTTNRLEYSLNFRLFRAKYFAVLVARNISESNAPLYSIEVKSDNDACIPYFIEGIENGYRNCNVAKKREIICTMLPKADKFDFEVQLTKKP